MVLSKVKFKLPTIADETNTLLILLKPETIGFDYSRYIYHAHPRLRFELKGVNKANFEDVIKKYVRIVRGKKYESLKGIINKYQIEWNNINDKYMKALEEILGLKWPKEKLTISVYVSISPVSLGSFDDWSFSIYYGKSLKEMKSQVAHEVFNYLLFMKWKKVFKRATAKLFEPPHIEWHLSEILATVIINNDPRIQKIIKVKEKPHAEHEKIMIGDINALEYFEEIYKRHLMSRTSFEKFLKTAYGEIKKHKALFV